MTALPRDAFTHGSPVVDGALRYLSPSAMDLADPSTDGGCLRRWWYRYPGQIREESSPAQRVGIEGHAQIEDYLLTGRDGLGSIARTALHAIPAPGPDLQVEHPLVPVSLDARRRLALVPLGQHDWLIGDSGAKCERCGMAREDVADSACGGKVRLDPATSVLSLEGVPIVGYRDLQHRRGTCQGASEILETQDPRGSVEVRDWKFTKDPGKWAKTRDQVLAATPMVAYGEAAAREALTAHVRLTHVYISTGRREPAIVVTGRLPREEVARRWEQRAPLVRLIRDAARATDPNEVDANIRACTAFRGCLHRSYCRAGQLGSLASLFTIEPKEETMSVLDVMKQGLAPSPPVQFTASAPVPAPAQASDPFVDACKVLDAASAVAGHDGVPFGWPPIAGEVAARKAAAYGYAPPAPGAGYGGSGKLGGLPWITDVQAFIAMARDVGAAASAARAPAPEPAAPVYAAERAAAAAPAPWPPNAIVPPDAPASQPHLASLPVAPTPAEVASGAPWVAHVQAAQAAAQAANPGQGVAIAGSQPAPTVVAEPEKKTRTRAKKAPAAAGVVAETEGGTYLHVDAMPFGPFEDMTARVADWCRAICAAYPDANGPACDIRSSANDRLAFGKWKGVLAAFAVESAPSLPSGNLYLRARGSDVGSVVAEALRAVVDGGSWGVS